MIDEDRNQVAVDKFMITDTISLWTLNGFSYVLICFLSYFLSSFDIISVLQKILLLIF